MWYLARNVDIFELSSQYNPHHLWIARVLEISAGTSEIREVGVVREPSPGSHLERMRIMAELKTKANKASVKEFLGKMPDAKRRQDCLTLLRLIESVTGSKPLMWGTSIVGFGSYHYVYKSGREGDWFLAGFSPRKQGLTIYLMGGLEQSRDLLEKLGKFKSSGGCLYIKTLEDVNPGILKQILVRAVKRLKSKR